MKFGAAPIAEALGATAVHSIRQGGLKSFENHDSAFIARVGVNYRWGESGRGP